MEGVVLERGLNVLPARIVEDALLLDRYVDQGSALCDDLPGAKCVVANLSKCDVLLLDVTGVILGVHFFSPKKKRSLLPKKT